MIERSVLAALFLSLPFAVTDPPQPTTPAATLDLGAPITVPVGKKIVITAETTAKKVTWVVPTGCDSLNLDGKRLAVWANPGTYTFTAMVPSGDDVIAKQIILTVTGAQPPPVVDTIAEQLQAAYNGEPTSVLVNGIARSKALDVIALAEAYRAHAKSLPTFKTANDAANDLLTVRQAAVAERIPTVRRVVGNELAKIMPSAPSTVLTDAQKKAAADLLYRSADILDTLK